MRAGVICLLALAFAQPALAQQPSRAPTLAQLQGMAEGLNAQLDSVRALHFQASAKVGELAAQNIANAEIITALKDQLATAQTAAATLAEENARLKAQIAEMEKVAPVVPVKPAD